MGVNNLFGIPRNDEVSGGYTKLVDPNSVRFSAAFGVTTNLVYHIYRLGDRLIGRGQVVCGTIAASVPSFTLPPGLTINRDLYRNLLPGNGVMVGYFVLSDTAAATGVFVNQNAGAVFFDGSDDRNLYLAYRSGSNGNGGYLKDAANSYLSNADAIDFNFDIPIAQWAV